MIFTLVMSVIIEQEEYMVGITAYLSDLGLSCPVNEESSKSEVYGVLTFLAPEVLRGGIYTTASDVYSFGMIMWMLSAGVRPYGDKPHNRQLIEEICSGLIRPELIDGTPRVFAALMSQCLDSNPSNRPTAPQIYEKVRNWTFENKNNFLEMIIYRFIMMQFISVV